jgi:hypothetical protein
MRLPINYGRFGITDEFPGISVRVRCGLYTLSNQSFAVADKLRVNRLCAGCPISDQEVLTCGGQ